MNHLAHLLLARPEEGWRLGALLGDFVKGREALTAWPDSVVAGIEHHRALDSWIDRHPLTLRARALAPGELRRYMGIVLDLQLDAWLCRHWRQFSAHPLVDFTADAYALLRRHYSRLPLRLQTFADYAESHQVLSRYHEPQVMDQVLAGIARRLSRPGPLAVARQLLATQQPHIDACFAQLFPAAQAWSAQWVATRKSTTTGS